MHLNIRPVCGRYNVRYIWTSSHHQRITSDLTFSIRSYHWNPHFFDAPRKSLSMFLIMLTCGCENAQFHLSVGSWELQVDPTFNICWCWLSFCATLPHAAGSALSVNGSCSCSGSSMQVPGYCPYCVRSIADVPPLPILGFLLLAFSVLARTIVTLKS